MRVIIGAVIFVGTLGVFAAVTAAIFIVQHIFAITVLGAAVAAVMLLARRSKRRRLPAHRPPHYPAIGALARPAAGGSAQWPAHGMSSVALPSRAARSLAPRRSYP
jgi:predicted lysophospholipase L1 biosynthesis ABC-type transport system permease subunit